MDTAGIITLILLGANLLLLVWMLARLGGLERHIERSGRQTLEELSRGRNESGQNLKGLNDSVVSSMTGMGQLQKEQLAEFSKRLESLNESMQKQLVSVRETVEVRLQKMQDDNARKLEDMRKTVDEKLQSTLEKRLNESFKLVSERLEQVHKGLGEMQIKKMHTKF